MQGDVRPPEIKVLLVHGVGRRSGDVFGSHLKQNIEALGLQPTPEILGVNWHEKVEKPNTTPSLYNPRYTAQLMRGLDWLCVRGTPSLFCSARGGFHPIRRSSGTSARSRSRPRLASYASPTVCAVAAIPQNRFMAPGACIRT